MYHLTQNRELPFRYLQKAKATDLSSWFNLFFRLKNPYKYLHACECNWQGLLCQHDLLCSTSPLPYLLTNSSTQPVTARTKCKSNPLCRLQLIEDTKLGKEEEKQEEKEREPWP